MTTEPFFTPWALKKLAARLERHIISVKVKVFSSPSSAHQTRAFFPGSAWAQASTTSKPKLKSPGTFIL